MDEKLKLILENIQNSNNFTYEQTLEIIGYIDPSLKYKIELDIQNSNLHSLHGKFLQEAIDNIICINIDKCIYNLD